MHNQLPFAAASLLRNNVAAAAAATTSTTTKMMTPTTAAVLVATTAASASAVLTTMTPLRGDSSQHILYGFALGRGAMHASSSTPASLSSSSSSSASLVLKEYNIRQHSLLSWTTRRNVLISLMRASALEILPMLENWFKEIAELGEEAQKNEEEELPPLPPFPDLKPALPRIARLFCRDAATVTLRRCYERLAERYLSQRLTWKLIKDLPDSAVRKAARHSSSAIGVAESNGLRRRLRAPMLMLKTTVRGELLAILASVSMTQTLDSIALLRALKRGERTCSECMRAYSRRTLRTLTTAATQMIGSALGAFLGTCAKPGRGTLLGVAIGNALAGLAADAFWALPPPTPSKKKLDNN